MTIATAMRWREAMGLVHVTPVDDLREHDASLDCWCKPVADGEEPSVIVHNSLDGREAFERGERLPS